MIWIKLKFLPLLFILLTSLSADQIIKKTIGCPTIDSLKKAPVENAMSDPMDLSLFVIANGCEILSRRDSVEAIGYDPLNSQETYIKILYKKTGAYLYMPRSALSVEQDGKKGTYRF